MTNTIKTLFASFGIATLLIALEYFLKSSFLSIFLKDNLVGLLLTLLAINTATSTVISSKLEDISERTGANFEDVIKEVRGSLIEQIVLIGLSVVLLIVLHSKLLDLGTYYIDIIINIFLTTILVYAIDILRDTGVAIFNIVIELNRKS
ncbi:MAG: hypothetical protein ABJM36_14650 [Algibacter sp.]|uniref:hypothetical protein n=1 Tax=Algibacter sp. TaxID=1872428 RepID=UPI00329A6BE4